jgi:hypothetical protein
VQRAHFDDPRVSALRASATCWPAVTAMAERSRIVSACFAYSYFPALQDFPGGRAGLLLFRDFRNGGEVICMCDGPCNSVDEDFENELSQLDDDYASAQAVNTSDVPDGRYEVRLKEVKLARSRNRDPMIKYDMVVLSGPHARRHIFKNSVISDASLRLIKAELEKLGLVLGRLSALPGQLDRLRDLTLQVSKRTAGEYVNVYFNKVIHVRGAEGSAEGPF